MRRILVTGAGGVGGINFVRALKAGPEKLYVVGTDYHPYYLILSPIDKGYKSPRHDDPSFVPLIRNIVIKHDIEFVHPQPEVEVEVLSNNRDKIPAKMLLPSPKVIRIARDKYLTARYLEDKGVPVPRTWLLSEVNLDDILKKLGGKAWIRARKGAGGRLSLPINDVEVARSWIKLWVLRKRVSERDFIIQEYLPGRDIAWDSLWYKGKLIMAYTRERLAYIFPHLSPSRITGTPTVARIIHDNKINKIAFQAIKHLDPNATGFYCIDFKEDERGMPKITEINIKAHTTLALWSYAIIKGLKLDWRYNIPYIYLKLGLGEEEDIDPLGFDIYPEGLILIRHLDAGVVLLKPNGEKVRIL